jgi:starch synthase (maltosyl-transferring)
VRICLVITELEPGGAERALVHLACGLQARNIDVFVISLKPLPESGRRELVDRLEEQGIACATLGIQGAAGFLRARKRLRSMLVTFQPHLVQSFLHHANILSAMTWHSKDPWKVIAGYRVADPGRWRRFLERRYRQRWCHFTCVSSDVAEDIISHVGVDREHVTTIPNAVDIARFRDARPLSSTDLGIPQGRRILGFIGRLHPQKGLEPLIPHLPRLFDMLPEHDLVIAGEGPRRVALRKAVQRQGLDDRIFLVGWSDKIPSLMASLDLLILPSSWEGMPNVILEAMAAEKPVVSFAVQGVADLLGDAGSPQVAAAGDYADFCQKVIDIVTSPERARQLGQRNATWAEQFSIGAMVDRYNQLYDRLCD